MISLSAAEGEPFEGDSCNVVRIEASNDSSPVGIDGCVLVHSLPPRVFDCCEVELASGWTSFTVLEFVDSNGDFRAGSVAAYSADGGKVCETELSAGCGDATDTQVTSFSGAGTFAPTCCIVPSMFLTDGAG